MKHKLLKLWQKYKKDIILVCTATLFGGFIVCFFKKPSISLPYPLVAQLPVEFSKLNCNGVSETYMRAWPKNSDLVGESDNSIQLSSSRTNAKIVFSYQDGRVSFSGDYLWGLDNKFFTVEVNNQYRMAGSLSFVEERAPHFDLVSSFMLDKRTGLLIISDIDTMITQNESFGTRSRLFLCSQTP